MESFWHDITNNLALGGLAGSGWSFGGGVDRNLLGGSLGSGSVGGWLLLWLRLDGFTSAAHKVANEFTGERRLLTLGLGHTLTIASGFLLVLEEQRCAARVFTARAFFLGGGLSGGLGSSRFGGGFGDGGGGNGIFCDHLGSLLVLGLLLVLLLLGLLVDETEKATFLLSLGSSSGLCGRGGFLGGICGGSGGFDIVGWGSHGSGVDGLVLNGLIELGGCLGDWRDVGGGGLFLGLLGGWAGHILLEQAAEDRATLGLLSSGCGGGLVFFLLLVRSSGDGDGSRGYQDVSCDRLCGFSRLTSSNSGGRGGCLSGLDGLGGSGLISSLGFLFLLLGLELLLLLQLLLGFSLFFFLLSVFFLLAEESAKDAAPLAGLRSLLVLLGGFGGLIGAAG